MLEWTCAVTEVMPVVCHSLGFPLRVSVTCAYFTLFIWMVPDFLDKWIHILLFICSFFYLLCCFVWVVVGRCMCVYIYHHVPRRLTWANFSNRVSNLILFPCMSKSCQNILLVSSLFPQIFSVVTKCSGFSLLILWPQIIISYCCLWQAVLLKNWDNSSWLSKGCPGFFCRSTSLIP